jgi:hypothetical protein
MTYLNSTIMEMLMTHNMRDIERAAENRRIAGELIHAPGRVRRDLTNLRLRLTGQTPDSRGQA